MTRINAGVQPSELHRRHLIAEYRELPRVLSSLKRSLQKKPIDDVLKSVPKAFCLGTGHVTFFYDKLAYLQDRFAQLVSEMDARGYQPSVRLLSTPPGYPISDLDIRFWRTWTATAEARTLVLERIAQRKAEKPHLYT